MKYYIDAFKKCVEFTGRTSRKGYWMFILFSILATIVLAILDGVFNLNIEEGKGLLQYTYSLAVLLPSLAIGVRRLHDSNHSGWWVLLPIVNFIMFIFKGTAGPNKYGPVPVEPVA